MTPITISVTEEDIRSGIRMCCFACPVAMAVSARIGAAFVAAGMSEIKYGKRPDKCKSFKTPESVRKFIDDFDSGKKCAPFTFELRDESV